MMKKISWLFLLTVFLTFFLHSCRTEDLLQEERYGKQAVKVSVIEKQQLLTESHLLDKLSHIQSKSGRSSIAKSARENILKDAIIGTREVLLAEDGNNKTYTFPIYRTYLSDKIENLVLKKNSDNTFSGFLIQYNITKEERNQYLAGQNIALTSKMKVYDVDRLDINISARVQTDIVGCLEITWETGTCSSDMHHAYGDTACVLTGDDAAPEPKILSIKDICNLQTGGNSSDTGGTPGPGNYVDPGASYSTFPFVSIGFEYYATEDLSDPNYIHYQKTSQYFQSLPAAIQELSFQNPDMFYYTYFYFKEKGITPATKAFITDRLTRLNNWYTAVSSNPDLPQNYYQILLNWAFKYLVIDDPDITWQEFYDQYLTTPCEKIKNKFTDPVFKAKVTAIDKPEVFDYDHEMGFAAGYPPPSTGVTGTQYPPMENTLGTHSVRLPDGDQYFGYIHSHNNESNGGSPIKIFSPYDVLTFLTSCVRNADEHGSIEDAYCMVITSEGNYMLQYSGTGNYGIGPNQINIWQKWYKDHYQDLADNDNLTQSNVEKTFVKFLTEIVNISGLEVYHLEKITGKASKINTDGTKTPCP
ncbi:hypothetical protein QF023_001481 [Chryseobacterium sp. SLBN-27]|uniref:hypothetical protein n=1 Tax=Chryseobacterium sp. SLBN-27 TaxID=3042287 RepID=UPI00285C20A0|nr:hypothetical protein [Chryseobacterium sp. SLBN-27]MDR6157965.1 hypothetical protein [Chryseobacterium sp. SLBN-27]